VYVDSVIIGAGHAGLAMSRCLADRGVEHVVLERGRLGERWRTARWDSFRLLTPAWMTRLPGQAYDGGDPDAFLAAPDLVAYLGRYARSFGAPVHEMTTVVRVRRAGPGYVVETDRGTWRSSNVVIATGYYSRPLVPVLAAGLPAGLVQANPASYRRPGQLPEGGVLVVGASSSGVQIADELVRSGRDVVLAVGSHTRLPRRYRDHDILWWLDRTGSLGRTDGKRREPSLQLSGSTDRVDLGALQERGVRLTGRLVKADGDGVGFAADLVDNVRAADARLARVLARIDGPAEPVPAVTVGPGPDRLSLRREGIHSVVWATGFGPSYPWLAVPVLDGEGHLRHTRGVTEAPGLYAVGLRFQHRRDSTYIDGARHDAAYVTDHLLNHRNRQNDPQRTCV
jgi:putative flavoprotein involved in K+ transport